MDMLSRQEQGTHILARGGFSINLQQETIAALARCEFPERTSIEPERWHWVHGQVQLPAIIQSEAFNVQILSRYRRSYSMHDGQRCCRRIQR